jgi:hypothetical protein
MIQKPNGAFINTKKVLTIIIFFIISYVCNAQQAIILAPNNEIGKVVDVTMINLPIEVTCKFKDNTATTLMLEKVNGDTLFFYDKLSQTHQSYFFYSNLAYIQFHTDEYYNKNFSAGLITTIAIVSTAIVFAAPFAKSNNNDELLKLSAVFFPVSLISVGLSIVSIISLPPKYSIKKYSLFVK